MTTTAPRATTTGRPLGGLFKHSAIYSAAPLLRNLISIGMTRFYTSWLGAAGYGVKEVVDLWMIALQQLLGQNVLGGMMRFYFDHKSEEARARVVSSCTILIAACAWAVCGVALLFREPLVALMFGTGGEIGASELAPIVVLTLLLIPFQLCTVSGFYYLMILKRSKLFTIIQTAKLLFEVALNFVLMGMLDLGVRGFLLSMLCGEALTTLGLVGWMLVTLRPRVDLAILRPILAYGAPLIPVGLCQMALHNVDRRLLLSFSDPALAQTVTGIYGLGYRIAYLVQAMIISPFMQVWHPFVFGVENEQERAGLVARVSTYCVLCVGAASMGLMLFGRQAAIVLSGDATLREAWRVIPWVSAGYVFWALYHVSQMPLLVAKRTGRLFGINLLAAGFNVGVNALLIPRLGFVGAGVTTLLTFLLLAVCGMLASRSFAHVPFEVGRLATTCLCVCAGGAAALGIDAREAAGALGMPLAIVLKALVLLALWGLLWRLVLEREERTRFTAWVAARLGR